MSRKLHIGLIKRSHSESGTLTALVGDETATRKRQREKNRAALSSVVAALFLASAKLVVALATGSLGILSEALHSALDLVGTGLSLAAVRVSGRPPDATHPYGHAKFESLAALFAVGLLSLTALGILREAWLRAFQTEHKPEPNVWAFAVLILSITIDLTRSRYLRRVAKRHGSQALEADAAHFATDLYGSIAVLIGLLIVAVGRMQSWPDRWLSLADAGAGALVAFIILGVSSQLALRAVHALTDRVPPNLVPQVEYAARSALGSEAGLRSARVRFVGDRAFADLSISVPRGLSLEKSSQISHDVIASVQQVIPSADVVINAVPVAIAGESAVQAALAIAARLGLGVHHVRAFNAPDGLRVDLHMEVPSHLSLWEAHEQADRLEAELTDELGISAAQVHIEPRHEEVEPLQSADSADLTHGIEIASRGYAGVHDIEVLSSHRGPVVTVHCYLSPALTVAEAHNITADLEKAIREQVPGIYRITVHPEPVRDLHIPSTT